MTDTLRKFFPELPYNNITIHHLLTHTSGLPDYEEIIFRDNYLGDKWDHKQIASNNDVINLLTKEKPTIHSKPGQKWQYSNTGYIILASIIEKVSGQTYKDFLAKNIFEPLDMKFSRVYTTRSSGETIKNFAYGHMWSDSLGRFDLKESFDDFAYFVDGIYGSKGISSTTGDLLKWDKAVVSQTLLGEAASKEFLFPYAVCDTTINGHYAYGVYVGKNQFGNYAYHSGGLPGYGHNYARYIDEDKTIIVLSNNQNGSMGSIAINEAIANILYNKQIESPYQHTYFVLDTLSLDSFTGSYSVKNWEIDIKREKNNLYQVFKGIRINFQPESNSKIYSTNDWDIQYEIVKGADKSIKYYRILYGVRDEMKKLK